MRPTRVVHVPPEPGCFLTRWSGSAQRDLRVPKKGKPVEGTNLPNAIPTIAFQRIVEADVRALPYQDQ